MLCCAVLCCGEERRYKASSVQVRYGCAGNSSQRNSAFGLTPIVSREIPLSPVRMENESELVCVPAKRIMC